MRKLTYFSLHLTCKVHLQIAAKRELSNHSRLVLFYYRLPSVLQAIVHSKLGCYEICSEKKKKSSIKIRHFIDSKIEVFLNASGQTDYDATVCFRDLAKLNLLIVVRF